MSAPSLCSALAIAESSALRMMPAAFFGVKLRMFERLVDLLAAHQVRHQPTLVDRQSHAANACFGFHRLAPYFLAFLSAG